MRNANGPELMWGNSASLKFSFNLKFKSTSVWDVNAPGNKKGTGKADSWLGGMTSSMPREHSIT